MADEAHLPKIFHPNDVQPASSRLYFFDANVWLELLSPVLDRRDYMRPYVELWRRLRTANGPFVVINALVISEVLNRYLRIRFEAWAEEPATRNALQQAGKLKGDARIEYKRHFRPSEAYQSYVKLFLADWSDIAPYTTYQTQEAESEIVPALLERLGSQTDFNDKFYAAFCKKQNIWLVSHDGDFYTGGLTVVTANGKILKQYEEMKRRQR